MADAPPSTVTVYGPGDQPVEVPASEAAALLRSGEYGLPENAVIPMQKDDGSWEQVTGSEAVQRAQSFTAKIGSAQDVADYQRAEEFSGLGNKALAYGSGLLDSAALGLGDAILAKGGDLVGKGQEVRSFIRDADRFAPGSRAAGQFTGFIAPLIFSGGTSAGVTTAGRVGRAATVLPRGLSAVAEGAGGIAARAVGGGLPGRFVAPVVSGAVELGVYGGGSEVSRTVVRDPQADGEALATAFGRGFLRGAGEGAAFGGALGVGSVALGAGGRLVERGVEAGKARFGQFVDTTSAKLRGIEETVAGKLPGSLDQAVERGTGLVNRGLDEATSLAQQVTGRTAGAEATTIAGKADRLARTVIDVDKAAVEKALQSTGANEKILQKAEGLGASREIAARQIVEELPKIAGKEGKVLTFAEQAEAAAQLRKNVGAKVGDALEALDAAGKGISVSVVVKKAQKEVVEDLRKLAGAEGYADKIESYLTSLKNKSERGRMGLKDFHQQRSFLDDMIFEAKASNSPARKGLEKVRAIMEQSFEASAQRAAKAAGNDAAAAYKAAKAEYRAARWVEEATAKGASRSNANRGLGFSEQVGALTGAVLGGGGVTGLVTSVASAAANRAIKQLGDQTTAAVLREMQRGKPLVEAIADVSRRNAGEKVQKFFELTKPVREKVAARLGGAREKAAGALKTAREKTSEVAGNVAEVGRAIGRTTVRGVQAVGRGAKRTSEAAILSADFENRRREVLAAKAAGPERLAQLQQRFVQAGAPPETAAAAAATQARGEAMLAAKMPPVPQRTRTLQPELSTDFPDPEAMATWLRIAKIVDSPEAALDLFAEGTLDAEEAGVFREQWPSYYRQAQDLIALKVQEMTERGEVLPYDKALQIGTLFDVVTDPTLEPSFIAAMQRPPPKPQVPPLAPSRRVVSKAPALFEPGKVF